MKNCVYRFINDNNEIIYIGKAKDLKQRLNSHTHLPKECYEERKRIEYITFDAEEEMDFAERYFILKENPKYNTILSGKEFGLRSIDLDIKEWIVWGKHKRKENILYNNIEDFETCFKKAIDELKILDAKIETLKELGMDFDENNNFTERCLDLIDEQRDLERMYIKKLEKMSNYNENLHIATCIYNRVTDIQGVIEVELKKIEDRYYKKCLESININGYYKEEIYYSLDLEFVCCDVGSDKWKFFLEGSRVNNGLETYAINHDLKNQLVDNIISNIQERLEYKYGNLNREIMMLDAELDYMKSFYPKYSYKKFNKPFIVYKIES